MNADGTGETRVAVKSCLYVLVYRPTATDGEDEFPWKVMVDELWDADARGRELVPAAFVLLLEAEMERDRLAVEFEGFDYEVVEFGVQA